MPEPTTFLRTFQTILLVSAMLSFILVPIAGTGLSFAFAATGIGLVSGVAILRLTTTKTIARSTGLPAAMAILATIVLPVTVSAILNKTEFGLISSLAFATMQVSALMLALSQSQADYLRLIAWYTGCSFALLVITVCTGEYGGTHDRLSSILGVKVHPNYISMIALSAAVGSTVVRDWLAWIVHLFAAYVCLACQSRGALLCIALSLSILFMSYIPTSRRVDVRQLRSFIFFTALIGFGLVFLVTNFEFVENTFLKMTDKTRGIGSGFSGRDIVWNELLGKWRESPIFGAGYYEVRRRLDVPTDGGYILVLAETGLVGLGSILAVMLIYAAANFYSRKLQFPRSFLYHCSILVAFAALNLLESRLQSAGNPLTFFYYLGAYSVVIACFQKEQKSIETTT